MTNLESSQLMLNQLGSERCNLFFLPLKIKLLYITLYDLIENQIYQLKPLYESQSKVWSTRHVANASSTTKKPYISHAYG